MKKSKAKVSKRQPTSAQLLGDIENIRADNNSLWMNILHIALRSNPDPTKVVIRMITENDKKVVGLLGKLAK